MDCSNCGKDIPYAGKVCPYCHSNKEEDKFANLAGCLGGAPGAILGATIFSLINGWWSIVGGILGFLGGMWVLYGIRSIFRSK
jgi:hypothetical protein